jgi:hypothetical protein
MTNTKNAFGHRRNASWAHTELPSIMYEDVAPELSGDAGSPAVGQRL